MALIPPGSLPGIAVHIGADILTDPRHARWATLPSPSKTIERMRRLGWAAGITAQHALMGEQATRGLVRSTLEQAVTELAPHGQLMLTFTGHSDCVANTDDGHDVGWCLYDGAFPLADIAAILQTLPSTTRVIVLADTCYAAALSLFTVHAELILIAACGPAQQVLARPTVGFTEQVEQLVLPNGTPNPECTSYAWLDAQLRFDTPDVERPCVWTNRAAAWTDRPFGRYQPDTTAHLGPAIDK